MRNYIFIPLYWLLVTPGANAATKTITIESEAARINPARVEVVDQESFKSIKGVSLKAGMSTSVEAEAAPDLVLKVQPPVAGRYVLRTHSAVDAAGRELMNKAKTKHESLFMKIAIDDARPVKRVVFVPWSAPESCTQELGKFTFTGAEQEIKVWLPAHVRLDYITVSPYVPPKVPAAVAQYQPKIVPPATRPRIWVNQQSLPQVRANLTRGENAPLWKKVQQAAAKPVEFNPDPSAETSHDSALENAAVNKAFIYLMTGDEKPGREAVSLIRSYLRTVEFNNLLDITREIGRAIYAGVRIYDWCYPLMTPEDRASIRADLMRFADDMEIGWPPFKQGVVNGHGSEAQLHCHLLSMAIAIYDEDPLPYQYCAYRILEELVPMRNFEYQSPRHNQGIGYGIYRFGWDMHAAWLLYRMSGEKVFNSNIEDVHKYWLYTRLPGEMSFPDGDGNVDGRAIRMGITSLMTSAYANNPLYKRDFIKQGGLPHDPLMVLLLNDPDLKPSRDMTSLPLTFDFGHILGGMVARTGWNLDKDSTDVVVMMTGGGYHFSNHQQADAGSFQIYYRGNQIVDLGQYVFYGTPYDINFNKRSISHSMMLAYDQNEQFRGGRALNDGGTRYFFPSPSSPKVVTTNPAYANGTVQSYDFGPSAQNPDYSYFSVDLASAYSVKINSYVRSFCFLNLNDAATPAALIVLDHMKTSGTEIKKYWQVNTLEPPTATTNSVTLTSRETSSPGSVVLQMLVPKAANRKMNILSGKDANSVFGHELTPPKPDAPHTNGHRIMFSPREANESDTFLTVMTMAEPDTKQPEIHFAETAETYAVGLADRLVVMPRLPGLYRGAVTIDVPADGTTQLLVTGLQPGTWTLRTAVSDSPVDLQVIKGKNTAAANVGKGRYTLQAR